MCLDSDFAILHPIPIDADYSVHKQSTPFLSDHLGCAAKIHSIFTKYIDEVITGRFDYYRLICMSIHFKDNIKIPKNGIRDVGNTHCRSCVYYVNIKM